MHKLAIRLSVLAVGITALALPAAEAKTSKHHRHWRHYGQAAYSVGPAQPYAGYYSRPGPICPAIGKSFDCKIWPPPYEDDPDRKVRGH
jgi:hypothetical protein